MLGVIFGLSRTVQQITPSPVAGGDLVVIGVGERTSLVPLDRDLLDSRSATAAYGVVSSSRDDGECISAAWLSLGAAAQARTGDHCAPEIVLTPAARLSGSGGAAVSNWSQLVALNSPHGVDLGRLQSDVSGSGAGPQRSGTPAEPVDPRSCITAVGPGAVLAAAAPDGSVAHYVEPSAWAAGGYTADCRVTIVDPVLGSEQVIRRLADRPDTTVLVVGLGPAGALSSPGFRLDPTASRTLTSVQLAYRLDPRGASVVPGALSSATTGEPGVITLSDVSAAITAHLRAAGASGAASPGTSAVGMARWRAAARGDLGVVPGAVSATAADRLLADTAALQRRGPIMATAAGVFVALLAAAVAMLLRRRWRPAPLVAAALTTWPVALLVGGLVPWYRTGQPVLAGIGTLLGAWVIAAGLARLLATSRRPAGIAGAAISLTATAAWAAAGNLGLVGIPDITGVTGAVGVLGWGTLLDSTTVVGPDWLGTGPGASGVCVGAALAIAAWWAERLPRRQSLVAIIGLVVIVGAALWPNVPYGVALMAGGAVLTFADTARSWVRQAIPWAAPLFVGTAAASLVAAMVGTVLLSLGSGTILLQLSPDSPRFGGVVMGWLASVTLAVWLEWRAEAWFAARDEGRLPDPMKL